MWQETDTSGLVALGYVILAVGAVVNLLLVTLTGWLTGLAYGNGLGGTLIGLIASAISIGLGVLAILTGSTELPSAGLGAITIATIPLTVLAVYTKYGRPERGGR